MRAAILWARLHAARLRGTPRSARDPAHSTMWLAGLYRYQFFLALPLGLLIVLTRSLGAWASPDRALSIQGVLNLLAGVGLFCALVDELHSPLRPCAWVQFLTTSALLCKYDKVYPGSLALFVSIWG